MTQRGEIKPIIQKDLHKHQKQKNSIAEALMKANTLRNSNAVYDDENGKQKCTENPEIVIQAERIDLSFPENWFRNNNSNHYYPPSYYTLSSKECLLLLLSENFRRQFMVNNTKRRPLVLALPNECNVQKFVCTTIRPTAFSHIPLIRNAEQCASFVADFINYEPLENITFVSTNILL